MKRFILSLFFLPALSTAAGAINPDVTQDNIYDKICIPGWTKTARPSVSYTNGIKYELLRRANISIGDARLYELDHIIPLAVGGAPRDPNNLQLQLWDGDKGAHRKDVLESLIHRKVCRGEMTLAEGQAVFDDWFANYSRFIRK